MNKEAQDKFLAESTFRCPHLHAFITPEHCKTLRTAPEGAGFTGGPSRPPQCKDCDWAKAQETKPSKADIRRPAQPKPKENTMPTEGTCVECGKTGTLLTKELCHKCHARKTGKGKPKPEAAPKPKAEGKPVPDFVPESGSKIMPKAEPVKVEVADCSGEIRVDFSGDTDLLEEIQATAHRSYRTPEAQVLWLLREAFMHADVLDNRPGA